MGKACLFLLGFCALVSCGFNESCRTYLDDDGRCVEQVQDADDVEYDYYLYPSEEGDEYPDFSYEYEGYFT